MKNISMFAPLFYSPPIGVGYCSALWDWKYNLGYRSSHMAKASTLVEIHRAIPQVWYDEDSWVLALTGNLDGDL